MHMHKPTFLYDFHAPPLQEDPSGMPVLIFDECHKAKNVQPAKGGLPTLTGMAVRLLQVRPATAP